MNETQKPEAKPNRGCLVAIYSALGLVVLFMLLLPSMGHGPEPERRTACKNNLKQIGLALHNYFDDYGKFPPAYIADKSGRPIHSWRVLILPYLDQNELYLKYRFDEPWNGEHNSSLHDTELHVYQCRSDRHAREELDPEHRDSKTMTSYTAIVGPNTLFPETEEMTFKKISDGSSNTLMVVEVKNSGIHWMEPRDLHVHQMSRSVNSPSGQGLSSEHEGGCYILLGDGSARFISDHTSTETIRRLTERNDGEEVGEF